MRNYNFCMAVACLANMPDELVFMKLTIDKPEQNVIS